MNNTTNSENNSTTPIDTVISESQTLANTEQIKINNINDIQNSVNNFTNNVNGLKAEYLSFDTRNREGANLCGNIKKYNNKLTAIESNENFSNSGYEVKEGFLRHYIPHPVPRDKNFKNSQLVKNINDLETQNTKYDIVGCRILDSNSKEIDYDTKYGPALSNNKVYNVNNIVHTDFYPLN